MSPDKLVGLDECLPAGYPKSGGCVVIRDAKHSSSKSKRKRSAKKQHTPWYQRSFR